MTLRYTPYYCEENVWWLVKERVLDDPHAVFVSNVHGSVALWSQRASPRPDGLTLWDYHVVALGRLRDEWHIIDLDCTAGHPLPVAEWIAVTFPFAGAVPEDVEPMFRIVSADELLESFRTDRSHMRAEDGGWLAPPPVWDPLADSSNLDEYTSMGSGGPGHVTTLVGLLEAYHT